MKRAWFLAVLAVVGFASAARADEVPEVSATARVTYYLTLGTLSGEKADALVALLKREFPTAQVEVLDGTLRVQTDGATFPGIQKVLDAQHLDGLPAPDEPPREKPARERKAHKPEEAKRAEPLDAQLEALHRRLLRLGQESAAAPEDRSGETAKVRVKVGELCEGCAECLAAALGKEFPRLKFVPEDAEVVVEADTLGQAAVQTWLAGLRGAAKAFLPHGGVRADADGTSVIVLRPETTVEDAIVVLEGDEGKEARLVLKGGGPKPAPRLEELERRLREAREAGREREVEQIEAALAQGRRAREHVDADALRRHAEMMRGRLEGLRLGHAERDEDLGALRERVEALRARLEGGKGDRRAPKPGADRPHDPRKKDAPQGPMAKWRVRIQHLTQALEHLQAAGAKDLAERVAAEIQETKGHAEAMAKKLRAEEEAQAAERRKTAEKKRLEDEDAHARKHEKARGEHAPAREGGDELAQAIRRLHQQLEELRKEVRELREKVGGGERR